MNELISRVEAINAMRKLQAEDEEAYGASIPEGFDGDRAVKVLKESPSVQSDHDDWTPVNSEPPMDGQKCLLTIETVGGRDRYVDIGTYSTNLYGVNIFDFCNKRGVPGWYWYSSEWGYCEILNVVAWKPLDEPYMGD